jgi:hypothetical protein
VVSWWVGVVRWVEATKPRAVERDRLDGRWYSLAEAYGRRLVVSGVQGLVYTGCCSREGNFGWKLETCDWVGNVWGRERAREIRERRSAQRRAAVGRAFGLGDFESFGAKFFWNGGNLDEHQVFSKFRDFFFLSLWNWRGTLPHQTGRSPVVTGSTKQQPSKNKYN